MTPTGAGSGGRCCFRPPPIPALQGCPAPGPTMQGCPCSRPRPPGLPPSQALPLRTEVASGKDSSTLCVDAGRNTTVCSLKRYVMEAVPLECVHTAARDGAQPPCLWTGAWIKNARHPGTHRSTIHP